MRFTLTVEFNSEEWYPPEQLEEVVIAIVPALIGNGKITLSSEHGTSTTWVP